MGACSASLYNLPPHQGFCFRETKEQDSNRESSSEGRSDDEKNESVELQLVFGIEDATLPNIRVAGN